MIEMGKKYRTRDGREVRIYAVDGAEDYCIHGAIKSEKGWGNRTWMADGRYKAWSTSDKYDLIEVRPEVTERLVVVRQRDTGRIDVVVYRAPLNPFWDSLGAINITHDGENLIKAEIVNE